MYQLLMLKIQFDGRFHLIHLLINFLNLCLDLYLTLLMIYSLVLIFGLLLLNSLFFCFDELLNEILMFHIRHSFLFFLFKYNIFN